MNFGERSTYYELLEVNGSASTREIHEAYLRIKSAYSNDSLALYSLVSPEERDRTLQELEQAYSVLSDENQRACYDQSLQFDSSTLQNTVQNTVQNNDPFGGSVVSIDRVPPMDLAANEEMLIPPALEVREETYSLPISPRQTPFHVPPGPAPEPDLKHLIAQEIEWKGALLKKIRELRGVSLEDMCAVTKLSKTYLTAIETEDFKKLPAPVFVRGFVVQICKALKLPHERAAAAYMARCYQARKDA